MVLAGGWWKHRLNWWTREITVGVAVVAISVVVVVDTALVVPVVALVVGLVVVSQRIRRGGYTLPASRAGGDDAGALEPVEVVLGGAVVHVVDVAQSVLVEWRGMVAPVVVGSEASCEEWSLPRQRSGWRGSVVALELVGADEIAEDGVLVVVAVGSVVGAGDVGGAMVVSQ